MRCLSSIVKYALIFLLLMGGGNLPVFADNASEVKEWQITKPFGKTRKIEFDTDEGTWMSVDISPDGKWVVFDLLGHIYRIPAQGGQAQSLTQESGLATNYHPRFSPDGKKIAFISDREGQNNLWMMNTDGSDPQAIFLDPQSRISNPKWSADGKYIIAVRSFPTYSWERQSVRLWQFPLSSSIGGPRKLVGKASGTQAYWPSPSPDGKYIYYQFTTFAEPLHGRQRKQHIKRLDLASGEILSETKAETDRIYWGPGSITLAPEVSPDGKWLAFARRLPEAKISYRGHEYNRRTALWLRNFESGEEILLMKEINADMSEVHGTKSLRVLPGYNWAGDSKSIVISQGGKIRRVWLNDKRIETIPFKATVKRTLSQMARSRHDIKGDHFQARAINLPHTTKDGKILVFEAVGSIWRQEMPNGKPEMLVQENREGLHFMPQISPNGEWVTFVSWDDEKEGHVWKVSLTGGKAIKLSQKPAEYRYPIWTPDGQSIIAVRDTNINILGRANGQNQRFEMISIPLKGGKETIVKNNVAPYRGMFGPQGRIYLPLPDGGSYGAVQVGLASGSDVSTPSVTLYSVNLKNGKPTKHFRYSSPEPIILQPEAQPSPDGKWLAFRLNGNIYLKPISGDQAEYRSDYYWKGVEQPITIDINSATTNAKRISSNGGYHLSWLDSDKLQYVVGNQFITYDLSKKKSQKTLINLQIERYSAKGQVALINARIITLKNREVIESGTIVISNNKISCVGECQNNNIENVIDLAGKTVVPGFIDVHAHHLDDGPIFGQHNYKSSLYLSHGVTTVLDPYMFLESGYSHAELIKAGLISGPRTYTTGPALHPVSPNPGIQNYQEALSRVEEKSVRGAISIKNFLGSRRDQRQMLHKATMEKGMTVSNENSDLNYNVSVILDGATGFEHPINYLNVYKDVAQFFGQAGTVYSPTLIVGSNGIWAEEYFRGKGQLWHNKKLQRFMPWRRLSRSIDNSRRNDNEYSFPILAETVADIKRAGGKIALGGHGEQFGLDSQWEIWTYGSVLSPMETLEVASLGGAYMLGLEDELGSIEVGKFADLVVLDNNPLTDIHHTKDIHLVIKDGHIYDGNTLDEVWPTKTPYGILPWYDEQMFNN